MDKDLGYGTGQQFPYYCLNFSVTRTNEPAFFKSVTTFIVDVFPSVLVCNSDSFFFSIELRLLTTGIKLFTDERVISLYSRVAMRFIDLLYTLLW